MSCFRRHKRTLFPTSFQRHSPSCAGVLLAVFAVLSEYGCTVGAGNADCFRLCFLWVSQQLWREGHFKDNSPSNWRYFAINFIIISLNIYKDQKQCYKTEVRDDWWLSFLLCENDQQSFAGWFVSDIGHRNSYQLRWEFWLRKINRKGKGCSTCFLHAMYTFLKIL